ncbi:hypothetical protein C1I98_27040 [Spongiactinospora gelatinilytica]|uniref:Uncharacterized protein n=1 Tax=Spongiactinospora gelatinilytica TaxID=2666298 RepID=A0A2W2G1J2_9ACTN|nr:hypothetical protein [Spongiactinospora gelatinilytica]PZG36199.1 hypothetical protein C1I98_27040 [Spongiactinospora gelatinilytica]
MRFPIGSRRLPPGVEVDPRDRVLAHAGTTDDEGHDDGHVVATDRALYLPGGIRVPWYLIDRGEWDEAGLRLLTTDGARHVLRVPEPGRLPDVVRERVTWSILVSRHVTLPGRGGVRLVARRVPDQEQPAWEFVFDEGLDPDDPGLRALAEQALESLRRSYGI